MAEETSEDGRDTDRDEAGDIDVDCLLLGMPDKKEDAIQHELESRAAMKMLLCLSAGMYTIISWVLVHWFVSIADGTCPQ